MNILQKIPEKFRFPFLGCFVFLLITAGGVASRYFEEPSTILDKFDVPAEECIHQFEAGVWLDSNGNGDRDVGETGVPDVEVTLINRSDESESYKVSTDERGIAKFEGLTRGLYDLQYEPNLHYLISDQDHTIDLTSCETSLKSTWKVAAILPEESDNIAIIEGDGTNILSPKDFHEDTDTNTRPNPMPTNTSDSNTPTTTPTLPTPPTINPPPTPQPTEILQTPVATNTPSSEVLLSPIPPPTAVSTQTSTSKPTVTPTAVPTQQPHNTATPQSTVLATATTTAVSPTQTPTTAPSATPTAVPTNTPTLPSPTSTAPPTPTATNTPLPSPTNTPTTAGYCPFSAGNGRYIINFNTQMIRSDLGETDAQLGPLPTNLPAGTYRISLVSYDPDHDPADASSQPAEKWYLLLQNAEEATIFISAPTGDLADTQFQQTFIVADEVFIAEGAAFGIAYHAAYPDESSPNSVYPVCGILEQLAADASPTPMPSASPESLITPNPTVITPHD